MNNFGRNDRKNPDTFGQGNSGVLMVRRRVVWMVVIAVVAAFAWLSYVLWSTTPFQDCLDYQEKKYEAAHETKENPPKGFLALFINARDDTVCGFSVLYEYRDAVTALATVFIAWFTLTLWLSTKRLSKEAQIASGIANKSANAATKSAEAAEGAVNKMDETARRQLRAYVFVEDDADIKGSLGIGTAFNYSIKNSGVTPAYEVVHRYKIVFSSSPQLPDAVEKPRSKVIIPPGGRSFTKYEHPALNPSERQALSDGKMTFYICGEIAFVDCFGDPQWATYRLMVVKIAGAYGVATCSDGNEAS